jgi:hypothetical protein
MATNEELAAAQRELRWHWRDSQVEIRALYPKERPMNPKVGDGWFNHATATFCVWDGHQWVSLPVD